MYREIEFRCIDNQLFFPLAHHRSAPAHNGIVVHRQRFVGNDQIGVDAHHFAKAFAHGTRANRVVETEHIFIRFVEHDAIGLERLRETANSHIIFLAISHFARIVAFVECGLHRIGQAILRLFVVAGCDAVNQQFHTFRFEQCVIGEHL